MNIKRIIIGMFACVALLGVASFAYADPLPQLLKDINTEGKDTYFFDEGGYPVVINGIAYYTFSNPNSGSELWKTDGTESGTVMVKDIEPGSGSSYPNNFYVLGDKLIFIAYTEEYGTELWISDGTEVGTHILKDIVPGGDDADLQGTMVVSGSKLYFVAENNNGRDVIYETDGTEVGTVIVGDIGTEFGTSDYYFNLEKGGNSGIFGILYDYDGPYTSYLIRYQNGGLEKIQDSNSDFVTDIWDGNDHSAFLGDNFVFISCVTGSCQPWIYNSGAETASMITDMTGNGNDANIGDVTSVGTGLVFFRACPDGYGDCEPWVTDGTELGTVRLADIVSGSGSSDPSLIRATGDKVYFEAGDSIWVTDGTVVGTHEVYAMTPFEADDGVDTDPESSAYVDGHLYFELCSESTGCELKKTGDNDLGVSTVKDIYTGSEGSYPDYFTDLGNGTILFGAQTPEDGYELWKTDGTGVGTVQVKDITSGTKGSNPDDAVVLGDKIIFRAYDIDHGYEAWVTDGTTGGTTLLKDIVPGPNNSDPYYFYEYQGKVYFTAYTEDEGRELWVTDGTEGGTMLLKDIYPGVNYSDPYYFAGMGGYVYFRAYEAGNIYAIWRSDGTEIGTTRVIDIDPGHYSFFEDLFTLGNKIIFRGYTNTYDYELWITDGTAEGTHLLKDIEASGGSYPYNFFTPDNVTAYFVAYTNQDGYELWKTDGTESGTVLVKDINPADNSSSSPDYFTMFGDQIIFRAYTNEYGTELWKTDGTEAGTVMVKNIASGITDSYPYELVKMGGYVYFSAYTPEYDYELWKTDGTESGTVLVKDINPEPGQSSDMNYLMAVGPYLYFRASGSDDNKELWRSDGTESGTAQIAEIFTGNEGSDPNWITRLGDTIFFFAEDLLHGEEPHILADVNTTEPTISGCTNPSSENYNSLATSDDGSCTTTQSAVSVGGGRPWTPTSNSAASTSTPSENTCPAEQLLTQNLKSGSRNGRYNSYTKGIVKEAKILQGHLNRLGFASGKVDGILGKISDGAIKRMQKYLGTAADGYVGPKTRLLINQSCGKAGLVR